MAVLRYFPIGRQRPSTVRDPDLKKKAMLPAGSNEMSRRIKWIVVRRSLFIMRRGLYKFSEENCSRRSGSWAERLDAELAPTQPFLLLKQQRGRRRRRRDDEGKEEAARKNNDTFHHGNIDGVAKRDKSALL